MDYINYLLHSLSKYGGSTRSIVKLLLRNITGMCELERLCVPGKHGYKACHEIEYSMYSSKNDDIRRILVADTLKVKDALQIIFRVKRLIPEEKTAFLSTMTKVLKKIISYNHLLSEVDALRNIVYDEDNEYHEAMLKELWVAIKGEDDELGERVNYRWTEIGFQGKNPATDFRGMGILGLKNLLYLFETGVGMKLFGQSNHPTYSFSFAIMGITFTSITFDLLRSGKLKGYLYTLDDNEYTLDHYQQFFATLFQEFADYWQMCKPENIMAFNEIRDRFMEDVSKRLSSGKW